MAQIVFHKTEGIADADYTARGKYQTTGDLEEMMENWHPSAMLPKMYNDREVRELRKTG